MGLDIQKLSKSPRVSLLGQKNLSIRTIIDVGANSGQFAKDILVFFPDSTIYCFEPLPGPFAELEKLAEGDKRITVFNVALGEDVGEVDMLVHVNHSPSSSFLRTTKTNEGLYPFIKEQATVKVHLSTLDKVFGELPGSLATDVLIKLDVQGYEDRVIRGGIETFGKAKICILEVGLDHLYEKQADFGEIVALLYSYGYRYVGNLNQHCADDGHVIFIDAVFLR